MAKFRFIGQYTGKSESINAGGPPEKGGVTFYGREPEEVENEELIRRLSGNPEFQEVASRKRKTATEDADEAGNGDGDAEEAAESTGEAENPPAESEDEPEAPTTAAKPKLTVKTKKKG